MNSRILLICIGMSTLAAMSMDIFLPSLPYIRNEFAITEEMLQLSISLFVWGFAIFQLFVGVLSDRFGRRPVFALGILLFSASTFGCALSKTYSQLLFFRVLQGFGACVGPVTALAVTRDLLEGKQRARSLSFISSAMAVAPILAPLIGGFLEAAYGWRSTFYFLAAYGVVLLASTTALSESLSEKQSIHWKKILKGYLAILKDKNWRAQALLGATSFAALFTWISASSIYLMDRLQLSELNFAFLFGTSAFFFMIGSFLNSRLMDRFSLDSLIRLGVILMFVGAFLMLIFAWTLPLGILRLWGPSVLLSLGIGFVLPTSSSRAMEGFRAHAGKAAALMHFSRLVLAGFTVWIASHFYDDLARNLSSIIFIFASLQGIICFIAIKNKAD